MIAYALNLVTVRDAPFSVFVDIAVRLGCVGVKVRNDLGRPLLDRLNQVYPFNAWSTATEEHLRKFLGQAADAGAISFERFAPEIHTLEDPELVIRRSMNFISPSITGKGCVIREVNCPGNGAFR